MHNFSKQHGQFITEDDVSLPKYPRDDREVDWYGESNVEHSSNEQMPKYGDKLAALMWMDRQYKVDR